MTQSRTLIRYNGRHLLILALMALGMNAFVPAGYMVAPSSTHFLAVTLCPDTNPLARAVKASDQPTEMGEVSAVHAAMGHHAPKSEDNVPAAGQTGVDCAFSALASVGDIPDQPEFALFLLEPSQAPVAPLPMVAIAPDQNLRPPSRGPPSHG